LCRRYDHANPDWPVRLHRAADTIRRTKRAPAWLAAALREAVAVAPALAPRPDAEAAPPEFIYAH
jgi:hypothetical protein